MAFVFDAAENLGSYIEVFGSQGLSAEGDPINRNGGFTYLLDDDTQFYFFLGIDLNNDTPDSFW